MKKLRKVVIIIALSFLLLLTVAVVFTQTGIFRSLVLDIIETQAAANLNGEVTISGLRGNFFSWLSLRGISVGDQDGSILEVAELSLHYNLLGLLRKKIIINKIAISGVSAHLQEEAGQWNFLSLIPEAEPQPEKPESKPFTWQIDLTELTVSVNSVTMVLASADNDFIPSSIENLELSLALLWSAAETDVRLHNLSFDCNWNDDHTIKFRETALRFTMIEEQLRLEDLVLRTENIILLANGEYRHSDAFRGSLELSLPNLKDAAYFLPVLDEQANVGVVVNVNGNNEGLKAETRIYLDGRKQEAMITNVALTYPGLEQISALSDYYARVSFVSFDPLYLLNRESEPVKQAGTTSFPLFGDITLSGNTTAYTQGDIRLDANLYELDLGFLFDGLHVKSLGLQAAINDGKQQTDLQVIFYDDAELKLSFKLNDLAELNIAEFPTIGSDYELSLAVNNLDLSKFAEGVDADKLSLLLSLQSKNDITDVNVEILPANIYGIPLEKFLLNARINREQIIINELLAAVAGNTIEINGMWSVDVSAVHPDNLLTYSIDFPHPAKLLAPFTEMEEEISASIQMTGAVSGGLGELSIAGDLSLQDTAYGNLSLGSLEALYELLIGTEEISSQFDIKLETFATGDFHIRDTDVKGYANIKTSGTSPAIEGNINLHINLDEHSGLHTTLNLRHNEFQSELEIDLQAHYYDLLWQTENRGLITYYPEGKISVDSLFIGSAGQSIMLDGDIILDSSADNDFLLRLAGIDLAVLGALIGQEQLESGILDFTMQLTGTGKNPVIVGELKISSLELAELGGFSLTGEFNYPQEPGEAISPDRILSSVINVLQDEILVINLSANVPADLSLTDGFALPEDQNINLSLSLGPLDAAVFDGSIQAISNLRGIVKLNLTVEHSLQSLNRFIDSLTSQADKELEPLTDVQAEGNINLTLEIEDGGLSLPGLGTSYRNINVHLGAVDNKLTIKQLALRSGEGDLSIVGEVLLVPDYSPMTVTIKASNFPAIANEALAAVFSSDISLTGTLSDPVFGGKISLLRARVNIDKLLQNGTPGSGDAPLLVKVREEQEAARELEVSTENDSTGVRDRQPPKTVKSSPVESSRGRLTVSFARNVIIRGADMNIELAADLELVKRDDFFEIFGNVAVMRGFYVFYGKRFQMETGEVLFAGGREINPSLSIAAGYSFRGIDMTRNTLRLMVSGSMEELSIAFELNDVPIPEADAISYILFGRSFDELTQGEKAEATNQAMVLGAFLANRLAGALTDFVGDRFNLDYIEFRSDTASSQVGLEVGKHLTDKLFVSFKKDFNLSDSKEPVTEEVIIEYEIRPFLFLQGTKSNDRNTGVDLLWRLKWE